MRKSGSTLKKVLKGLLQMVFHEIYNEKKMVMKKKEIYHIHIIFLTGEGVTGFENIRRRRRRRRNELIWYDMI